MIQLWWDKSSPPLLLPSEVTSRVILLSAIQVSSKLHINTPVHRRFQTVCGLPEDTFKNQQPYLENVVWSTWDQKNFLLSMVQSVMSVRKATLLISLRSVKHGGGSIVYQNQGQEWWRRSWKITCSNLKGTCDWGRGYFHQDNYPFSWWKHYPRPLVVVTAVKCFSSQSWHKGMTTYCTRLSTMPVLPVKSEVMALSQKRVVVCSLSLRRESWVMEKKNMRLTNRSGQQQWHSHCTGGSLDLPTRTFCYCNVR